MVLGKWWIILCRIHRNSNFLKYIYEDCRRWTPMENGKKMFQKNCFWRFEKFETILRPFKWVTLLKMALHVFFMNFWPILWTIFPIFQKVSNFSHSWTNCIWIETLWKVQQEFDNKLLLTIGGKPFFFLNDLEPVKSKSTTSWSKISESLFLENPWWRSKGKWIWMLTRFPISIQNSVLLVQIPKGNVSSVSATPNRGLEDGQVAETWPNTSLIMWCEALFLYSTRKYPPFFSLSPMRISWKFWGGKIVIEHNFEIRQWKIYCINELRVCNPDTGVSACGILKNFIEGHVNLANYQCTRGAFTQKWRHLSQF